MIHFVQKTADGFELEGKLLILYYEDGDVDTQFKTWKDLFKACYDFHQMNDGLNDGDLLSYAGVEFARIESFHVIPIKNEQFFNADTLARTVLP